MFDPASRYASIPTAILESSDGTRIPFKRRRFPTAAKDHDLLVEVTVTEGERLDLIAGRTLGDPELFWRICDANDAMNPFDLVGTPGRRLRVPMPRL